VSKHACITAAVSIAILALALATPAAALAQSSPPTGTGGDCFLGICDPGAWLRDVVGQIVAGFLGGLISGIGGAIASLPNDVDFLLRTPEKLSYENDTIQQFAGASRALANGVLALVGRPDGPAVREDPAGLVEHGKGVGVVHRPAPDELGDQGRFARGAAARDDDGHPAPADDPGGAGLSSRRRLGLT
jgi:hypothetical protein